MKMLVDSKTYYETFSFMDGYLGYNKIKIHLEDKEMTALSPKSVFLSKLCYLTWWMQGLHIDEIFIFEEILGGTGEC